VFQNTDKLLGSVGYLQCFIKFDMRCTYKNVILKYFLYLVVPSNGDRHCSWSPR